MNSHEDKGVSRTALKNEALGNKRTLDAFKGDFSQGEKAAALQEAEAKRKHKQEMRAKDLGWLGRFLGGEKSAPLTLAFLAIVANGLFMGVTLYLEAKFPAVKTRRPSQRTALRNSGAQFPAGGRLSVLPAGVFPPPTGLPGVPPPFLPNS